MEEGEIDLTGSEEVNDVDLTGSENVGEIDLTGSLQVNDEELPQIIGVEDDSPAPYQDLTNLMDKPSGYSDEQLAYIEEQRTMRRKSFSAAANALAMKNFEKAMKFVDIPHSSIKTALMAAMQGVPIEEIAQLVQSQVTDYDKIDAPSYGALIMQAGIDSGMEPSFNEITSKWAGGAADLIAPLDPINIVSEIGKIKPVSKALHKMKSKIVSKPIEWTKSIVEKFAVGSTELTPNDLRHYIKRFKEIESMSGTDLKMISDSLEARFQDMMELAHDKNNAALNLLDPGKQISSDDLKAAISEAANELNVAITRSSSKIAEEANGMIKRIDDAAQGVIRGMTPFQLTNAPKIMEINEKGVEVLARNFSEKLPETHVREMLRQLDDDIVLNTKLLTRQSPMTKFNVSLRKKLNEIIRTSNTDYAEKMDDVAPLFQQLEDIQKLMKNSEIYGLDEKLKPASLKKIANMPQDRKRQIKAIKMLEEGTNNKYLENINDRVFFEKMLQSSTRGSAKTQAFGGAGKAAGGVVGYVAGGDPMTAFVASHTLEGVMKMVGRVADSYGRQAARSVISHTMDAESFGKKFVGKITSSLPGRAVGKAWNMPVLKHFKLGIASSLARMASEGSYERFNNTGEIKVDNKEGEVSAALDSIKSDKSLSAIDKYYLRTGIMEELKEFGEISMTISERKPEKPKVGEGIPQKFFEEALKKRRGKK